MTATYYTNVDGAIQAAIADVPCGVGYLRGSGWFVYDLREGCKFGEPEFFVPAQGRLPIPLNSDAAEAFASMVVSKLIGAVNTLTSRRG